MRAKHNGAEIWRCQGEPVSVYANLKKLNLKKKAEKYFRTYNLNAKFWHNYEKDS